MNFTSSSLENFLKLFILIIFTIYLLIWLPWFVIKIIYSNQIYDSVDAVPHNDVAVVFGGLYYTDEEMTETNQERLLAAKALLDAGKVDKIVISNAEVAADGMKDYLMEAGVPGEDLILDSNAIVTSDTCENEAKRNSNEKVIFVSHGYHLPRILYQCRSLGLNGSAISVENLNLINRDDIVWYRKLWIRFSRYQREAFLISASVIKTHLD